MHLTNLLLVLVLLVLVSFGNSLLQDIAGIQGRSIGEESHICSRTTACKYAICLRRNSNYSACSFVPLLFNSNCVCPPRQICTINTDMSELIPPFVYHYHCRDPWQVLGFPKI